MRNAYRDSDDGRSADPSRGIDQDANDIPRTLAVSIPDPPSLFLLPLQNPRTKTRHTDISILHIP